MGAVSGSLRFLDGSLRLEGMDRAAVDRTLAAIDWRSGDAPDAWLCDGLHYATVRQLLDETRTAIADRVPRWHVIDWPHPQLHPLRPEQEEARAAWLAQRQGVIVMPTGTGKTEIALQILADVAVSASSSPPFAI